MNDTEYQSLLEENRASPTAVYAIKMARGDKSSPNDSGLCLRAARQAVEGGNKLPSHALYGMAPGIANTYAGDVGDAFFKRGWQVDRPLPGDLVFQRGKPGQMKGQGLLVSPPWGHVGVVFYRNGEPWVFHNTTAVRSGEYIASRPDVAQCNRIVKLSSFGDCVIIRIPPEELGGKCEKPTTPQPPQLVILDGEDISGKRVEVKLEEGSTLVVNATDPRKVYLKSK